MIPKSDPIIESLKYDLSVAAARTIEQAETICELRKQLAELRSGVVLRNQFDLRQSAGRSSKHRR
jgi:hypothetical protein